MNFSTVLSPPSKYIAPTIASKQSLLILSADLPSFLFEDPNNINLFKKELRNDEIVYIEKKLKKYLYPF